MNFPRPTSRLRGRRTRLLLQMLVLGVVLVAGLVAPVPSVATVRAMQVQTETPALARKAAARPTAGAAARWGTRRDDIGSFRMIGVGANKAGPPVRVRVHDAAGWSSWQEVELAPADGPDRQSHEHSNTVVASEPLWVGSADGYELDAPTGTALRVHLVRESNKRITVNDDTRRAGAEEPPPVMTYRDSWGARAPKVQPTLGSTVRAAFVHHTAGSNDYTQPDVPSILRGIQAYHMDANGWDDVGYNFLVDKFGGVWEGRAGGIDRAVMGAHTEGFNAETTGVSVLGTYTDVAPSTAALDAVSTIVGWKLGLGAVDPSGTTQYTSRGNERYPNGQVVTIDNVSGHRDAKPTACPGQLLYNRLPDIRRATSLKAASITPYPGFGGGLYAAAGNVDADAPSELITGADIGGGPHVKIFDADGTPKASFFAFATGFTGGVRVAAGNVEALGNGEDNVIAAAGPGGGPHVRVLRPDGSEALSVFAYDGGWRGGVYVAAGQLNAVAGHEIVTGPGAGGGPHIKVISLQGLTVSSFFAYGAGFSGGVRVAVGDVDGDGIEEIITAAGPGGGPHVRVFATDGTPKAGFFAYGSGFTGGVYVGTVRSPDGKSDWIVTGAGEGGGPHIRVFDGNGNLQREFFADDPNTRYGSRPAGGLFRTQPTGDIVIAGGPGAPPVVRFRSVSGRLIVL